MFARQTTVGYSFFGADFKVEKRLLINPNKLLKTLDHKINHNVFNKSADVLTDS